MPEEAVDTVKRNWQYAAALFGFLLGIHNGCIALWEDGNPEPVKIFPYPAQYLPKADYQALEKGIRPGNDRELQQLLEDYLS